MSSPWEDIFTTAREGMVSKGNVGAPEYRRCLAFLERIDADAQCPAQLATAAEDVGRLKAAVRNAERGEAGPSRHDVALVGVWRVVGDIMAGCGGYNTLLTMHNLYSHDEGDFRRLVAGAVTGKLREYGQPDSKASREAFQPGTCPHEDMAAEDGRASVLGTRYARSELAEIPAPEPLIDDVLCYGESVIMPGEPGTLKTFLALDWACSVATGTDWLSRKVHGTHPVLYVAGEGGGGLHDRLRAWEADRGVKVPDDKLTTFLMPRIGIAEPAFWVAARAEAEATGARLIILDTYSALSAGADEIESLTATLGYMERLAADLHASVILCHHKGWEAGNRGRGGSQQEGNVSRVIVVSRTDEEDDLAPREVWVKKVKDGPSRYKMWVEPRLCEKSLVLDESREPDRKGSGRGVKADGIRAAILEAANGHRAKTTICEMVAADLEVGEKRVRDQFTYLAEHAQIFSPGKAKVREGNREVSREVWASVDKIHLNSGRGEGGDRS